MRNFLLFLLFCGFTAAFFWWFTRQKPVPQAPQLVIIEPSGGEWFPQRLEIPVPQFMQNDPKWGKETLAWGKDGDTLGSAGCAVASAAMILASYGIETDPSRLNKFLIKHKGFTPEGWLIWEKACGIAPEKVRFAYEDIPTYKLIDSNLKRGNPVIVRLRYPSGITHFVVVCGKEGHDYLIRDPGRGAAKGVYPLKEFGSKVEALRFYEKVESDVPSDRPQSERVQG